MRSPAAWNGIGRRHVCCPTRLHWRNQACFAELVVQPSNLTDNHASRRQTVLELIDHPLFPGAVAPLVVALVAGFALSSTRFAWLAVILGYAMMIALDTGFSLIPPTVARKTMLIGLLSPLVGIVADTYPRLSGRIAAVLTAAMGLLSIWVFLTALENRTGAEAAIAGAGVGAFVAALIAATLRLREDGLRCGAAGAGLGLAVGIAGILSASISYSMAGLAVGVASGAMLIVQVVLSRPLAAGFTGALPVGLLAALIAAGTQQLAFLPWYALPLLLLVPVAVSLPVPTGAPLIARAAVLFGYALVAAAVPITAAWYAARGALF